MTYEIGDLTSPEGGGTEVIRIFETEAWPKRSCREANDSVILLKRCKCVAFAKPA